MGISNLDRVQQDAVLETFLEHAKEINTERRGSHPPYSILAEVGNNGEWMGCGRVTPGISTMAAHNGKSVVIFFPADRFGSVADVIDTIYNIFDAAGEEE